MAIINQGRILLEAEPLRAIEKLAGKVWRSVVDKQALPALEQAHAIISTKLLGGRTVVRVYRDASPGAGFEAVPPDLEDVYFTTMAGHYGQTSAQEGKVRA